MTRPMKVRAALTLTKSRASIDNQLLQIKEYLESTGMGYKKPLIDKDGFPIPDIDHYRIVSERQHAARLLNDRKRIEFIIDCLTQTEGDPTHTGRSLLADLEELCPFAIIDEVMAESPAEKSGFVNGDFLLQFGSTKSYREIPQQVTEGVPVVVTVFRVSENGKSKIELSITPEKWKGNGLIGCHIQPFAQ